MPRLKRMMTNDEAARREAEALREPTRNDAYVNDDFEPTVQTVLMLGDFEARIMTAICCGVRRWWGEFVFGDSTVDCCLLAYHETRNEAVLCTRLRAEVGFAEDNERAAREG